jgi:murein DD-endopeptidase MepM/ murein hydrolase activator NlpD
VDPVKDGRSWYAYVGNDPVNFTDPLGLAGTDAQSAGDGRTEAPSPPYTWPLPGYKRETSEFGTRADPFTGRPRNHPGADLAAPARTSVVATAPGTVVDSSGLDPDYGGTVLIDHGGGVQTLSAHLDPESTVPPGTVVDAGDEIGEVAEHSGKSTGPHMHFELREHGRPVDPTSYLENAFDQ